MEKWNPFKKKILKPDQDEYEGSGEDGYGVPRDASSADVFGVMPDSRSEEPKDGSENLASSEGNADPSAVSSTPSGMDAPDTGDIQGTPGMTDAQEATGAWGASGTTDQGTPGTTDNQGASGSADTRATWGTSDAQGTSDMSGSQGLSDAGNASGTGNYENSPSQGDTFDYMRSGSSSGDSMNQAGAADGSGSFGGPGTDAQGAGGYGTSDASEAYGTTGAGAYGTTGAGAYGTTGAGAYGTTGAGAYGTTDAGVYGTTGAGAYGTSGAGAYGTGGPADPNGPGGSGSDTPHDFDDDEPKFDTQTGEPLNKPKKKLPAILLTAAVSVFAVGAFIYAVNPGALPSRNDNEKEDQVETEVVLAIADGSETEGQAVTEAAQTEAEDTGTVLSAVPMTESAQTEAADENAAQTEAAGENEAQTEAAETEADKDAASEAAGSKDPEKDKKKKKKAETEEAGETETETEVPGDTAEPGVPQFKTEGVTVSASLDVSDMVEEVMPEIVSVTATSIQTVRDFFYGLQQFEQTQAGSGIIIGKDDSDLYIVTDAYILGDAVDVTVGFCVEKDLSGEIADEDTLSPAQVIGVDDQTGLAVLKVSLADINETVASLIKPAVLGDSDKIRVGERAIAIGNAMGRGLSVTQGIISAVDRPMKYDSEVFDFIQTDASINYGNYGGALLNEEGEVIGINAGKISDDSSEGMGFAFPINLAKESISNMVSGFRESSKSQEDTAVSGSDAQTKDTEEGKAPEEKAEEETKQLETLAIADDYDDEEAAVKDDAKETEGQKAEQETEEQKAEQETGEQKAEQETEEQKAEQETGEQKAEQETGEQKAEQETGEQKAEKETEGRKPDEETESQKPDSGKEIGEKVESEKETQGIAAVKEKGQLGIQVGEFSKEDQIIYRIPAGAVIASVMSGSGAEAAGLQEGDLICGIDDDKVESVEDLQAALSGKAPGETVEVSFLRSNEESGYDKDNVLKVKVTLQ